MPKKFMRSFKFAQDGAKHILRTQRNMWIHLGFGLVVVLAALFLRIEAASVAVLFLAITLVIVAEMINTAIEETINLVKPEQHPLAELIKNVSAAAVLSSAVGSVVVGLLIFIPRLIQIWLKY